MMDGAGAVVFTERFDPHGQSVLRISPSGPYYQSHKFTGYERDYGTNTDNAKARQYHHNNGRFMQADPLSLEQMVNQCMAGLHQIYSSVAISTEQ